MSATYPIEFKRQVIQRYIKRIYKIAQPRVTHLTKHICHWRKLYCSIQTAQRIYTPKELEAISRRPAIFLASGSPHDNAVAESSFATFKKEEAYRREYTSGQSFRKGVERYIQFYNEIRPHQTQNKTPQAFEGTYWARFIENQCSNSESI